MEKSKSTAGTVTCSLNDRSVQLPQDLFHSEDVIKRVLTCDTWDSLEEAERTYLKSFLPTFPWGPAKHQDATVKLLLSSSGCFKDQSPHKTLLSHFRAGRLDPDTNQKWEKNQRIKFEGYKIQRRQHLQGMLEQLVVLRQAMLDDVRKYGPHPPKRKRIMKGIKSAAKDTTLSSDDDLSDGVTDGIKPKADLSEAAYVSLLRQHRHNRRKHKNHPSFDTSGISLTDVISRVNPKQKKGVIKRKLKGKVSQEKSKKLLGARKKSRLSKPLTPVPSKKDYPLDAEPHQHSEHETEITCERALQSRKGNDNDDLDVAMASPLDAKLKQQQQQSQPVLPPSELQQRGPLVCFFSVIRQLFKDAESWSDNQIELEKRMFTWECSASADDTPWMVKQSSWTDLLVSALQYMSGEGKATLLNDFVPLVVLDVDANEWRWTDVDHDDDSILQPFCAHWLDTLHQETDDEDEAERLPREGNRTSYVVRPTTGDQKVSFREQECRRYDNPHLPYLYSMHGFQSIVGPVKGVFGKDSGVSKAREHALLISNRPAYVTILSLVRDAVARLPNGEGTRAEVCEMLKDSQFLNPKSNDAQIHGVVSGALDRLHAEKDPCVKYDITGKVWIYLHKTRTIEQFELLHQACAAAATAKKQLHQRHKSFKQKKALQELAVLQEDVPPPLKRRKQPKKVRAHLPSPPEASNPVTPRIDDVAPVSVPASPTTSKPSTPGKPEKWAVAPTPAAGTTAMRRPTSTISQSHVISTGGVTRPPPPVLSVLNTPLRASLPPQTTLAPRVGVVASAAAPRVPNPASLQSIKGAKLTIGYLQSLGYGTSKQTVRFDLDQLRTAMEKSRLDAARKPPSSEP